MTNYQEGTKYKNIENMPQIHKNKNNKAQLHNI